MTIAAILRVSRATIYRSQSMTSKPRIRGAILLRRT
jgi:hypothetical protein